MNSSAKKVNLINSFDYGSLDEEQQFIIKQRTGEIRDRLRRSAQDIWEIGQKLADVRSRLKHGQFDVWLKVEFGWSRRTAYNFISVYETFGERATLSQVDIATSALYLLAAPSTSQKVRDEFLQKARVGQTVTYKELKETIQKEKSEFSPLVEASQPPQTITVKPEIVTIVPKSGTSAQPQTSTEPKQPVNEVTPIAISTVSSLEASEDKIAPGWHLLDKQHLLFCGDTASPTFIERINYASIAIAITNDDWDHDWLVERAKRIIIFPESDLSLRNIGQLLDMLSSPGETVIFPWLPHAELLIVAHQLQRKIYAGDSNPERCYRAITQLGLTVERLS